MSLDEKGTLKSLGQIGPATKAPIPLSTAGIVNPAARTAIYAKKPKHLEALGMSKVFLYLLHDWLKLPAAVAAEEGIVELVADMPPPIGAIERELWARQLQKLHAIANRCLEKSASQRFFCPFLLLVVQNDLGRNVKYAMCNKKHLLHRISPR